MANAFIDRKMTVFSCIDQLPANEREHAYELYAILDTIEFLTVIPLYLGMFAFFVPLLIGGKFLSDEGIGLLYLLGGMAFSYAVGVFILKKLIFNPFRNRKVNELRKMLFNHDYRNMLEKLKQLDPDMARNIKGCIAQAA